METFDPLETRLWAEAGEGNVESIAALAALLSRAADEGNETAAVELNRLLSAITPEKSAEVAAYIAGERVPEPEGNLGSRFVPLGGGLFLVAVAQ